MYIRTDYQVSVREIREYLQGVLEATPLWNRKAWGLQVTDLAERVELRVLVSASDASVLWDLRCLVREKMLEYLQARQATAGHKEPDKPPPAVP